MTDERLEQLLAEHLIPETPGGEVNEHLKNRMAEFSANWEKERKRDQSMKKRSMIKAAGLAAAVGWTYSSTWTTTEERYTEFDRLSMAQEKAGMSGADLRALEEFRNGYRFEAMQLVHNDLEPDSGKLPAKYDSLDIRYWKFGAPMLELIIEPAKFFGEEGQEESAGAQKEIEGVTVRYHENMNKTRSYPEGYEVTEEEKAELEREGYTGYSILAHTKEITEKTWMCYDVVWKQDGLRYRLMSNGNGKVSAEELFDMAEELITKQ